MHAPLRGVEIDRQAYAAKRIRAIEPSVREHGGRISSSVAPYRAAVQISLRMLHGASGLIIVQRLAELVIPGATPPRRGGR
jgi:hypothetical protein